MPWNPTQLIGTVENKWSWDTYSWIRTSIVCVYIHTHNYMYIYIYTYLDMFFVHTHVYSYIRLWVVYSKWWRLTSAAWTRQRDWVKLFCETSSILDPGILFQNFLPDVFLTRKIRQCMNRWWFHIVFYYCPTNLTSIFFRWVVQPPTSCEFLSTKRMSLELLIFEVSHFW